MNLEEKILKLTKLGLSQRAIASSCQCSRKKVIAIQKTGLSGSPPDNSLPDQMYSEPDFEAIHAALAAPKMTLMVQWEKYVETCKKGDGKPYMYSRFADLYRQFTHKTKATMHLESKPGEIMETDWAGTKGEYVDRETGEIKEASLFVASLRSSKYTYAELFADQSLESWIQGHIHAFEYYGGVPRIIVPDNLKTGVTKPDRYEPDLNSAYLEMADYYGAAIVPARVKKPRDKNVAENSVGNLTPRLLLAGPGDRFFSLIEYNQTVLKKLTDYNNKPFQKIPGSRSSVFLAEEKQWLQPLPGVRYEMATWKQAIIQYSYHISCDHVYYSTPYEYIKQKVDVRLTRNIIEVFYKGKRICSHTRLYTSKKGQYVTNPEHMPPAHRHMLDAWDDRRFLQWSERIGPCVHQVIQKLLTSRAVPQQAYKSCMGVLSVSKKYTSAELEWACNRVLAASDLVSYKAVEERLKRRKELSKTVAASDAQSLPQHSNIRGSQYYKNIKGDQDHVE